MVRPFIKHAGLFALLAAGGIVAVLFGANVQPGYFAETLLGQVGVTVGILPNPYNTLNDQLLQKEAALNEKEQYLNEEQAALASSSAASISPAANPWVWYLSGGVIVLAVLVFLNFYLDWRRSRRAKIEE